MSAVQRQGVFNVDNTKELTHISLCAGYGGIDLGLSRTLGSIRTVCFVEIESFAIKNLVSKIEKGLLSTAPIFTDLKKFPWRLFNGKVDLLSGGFPCQPFSVAGRKQGDQDPRHLWPYITKGIEQLGRPPIVFFENVSGIISSKLKGNDWTDREGTSVLLHVLRELERLGYKTTAGIFSATEVGAPHQRKRVFILGVRNELQQSGVHFINELINSNQSDRGTAWPASRGQRPHWYEPPRVTMGNTMHDGSLDSKESRDTNEASDNNTQGQESTLRFEGASRPCGDGSIQTSKLGNFDGRNQEPYGSGVDFINGFIKSNKSNKSAAWPVSRGQTQFWFEPPRVTMANSNGWNGNERTWCKNRLFQEKTKLKETNRIARDNDARQSEICRKSQSSVGRDTYGTTNWLDYAKLFESCESRTDELRLLGNGVIPDTAGKAFKLLWERLAHSDNFRQ
tara:strand:+ start:441 stop:1796 length:1356 start_codon:yes stop_codon:yes gene_type:complete